MNNLATQSRQKETQHQAKAKEQTNELASLKLVNRYGQGTRAEIAAKHAECTLDKEEDTRSYRHEILKSIQEITEKVLLDGLMSLKRAGLVEITAIRQCKINKKASKVWRCTPIGSAAVEEKETENAEF